MIGNRLSRLSVTRKLTLISLLTSAVGLLVTCSVLVVYDQVAYRRSMARDLSSIAAMTGFNSLAALTFDDPASAAQTLKGLAAQPNVTAACLYSADGQVFAAYRREGSGAGSWPALGPVGERFSRDALELYRPVTLNGETVGTIYLRADLQELAARLSRDALIAALAMAAAGAISYWVGSRLQKVISNPVSHLAGVVQRVAAERDYSLRASQTADDELGQLIAGFNDMLAQIQTRDEALRSARDRLEERVAERTEELETEIANREQLHRQLVDASRQAGMAEVATGVLHNVGNVLNSVNVSATLAINLVRRSKTAHLPRLAALLETHRDDLAEFITHDSKGQMIPGFLRQLATDVDAEQGAVAGELEQLRQNIDHIKQIVAMQQSYAKVSGVTERVGLTDLVEDALRLNSAALARHGVEVVRDFGENGFISVDRHKVLQILVNLIHNAKYACDDAPTVRSVIRLRVSAAAGLAQISVSDNGVGIPSENLTRIFNHGFTTRKNGHGFGLHSGAIVAKELGGSLFAESAGLGQGATFILELPLQPVSP